jgi:hypothetical protein
MLSPNENSWSCTGTGGAAADQVHFDASASFVVEG